MRIIVLAVFLLCVPQAGLAKNYRINCPVEIDSLLVAWLIDRFVDHAAEFTLTTKDKINLDVTIISINSSDSPYRRKARHTAFDTIVKESNIHNNCIEILQHYDRILEMMPWRKLEYPDALEFERTLKPLLPNQQNGNGLQQSFAFIDQFCASKLQAANGRE